LLAFFVFPAIVRDFFFEKSEKKPAENALGIKRPAARQVIFYEKRVILYDFAQNDGFRPKNGCTKPLFA
jgi:hypothetical protein